MDKKEDWEKEFKDKFSFVANKGVQCDEITLQNIVVYISQNFIPKDKMKRIKEKVEGMQGYMVDFGGTFLIHSSGQYVKRSEIIKLLEEEL